MDINRKRRYRIYRTYDRLIPPRNKGSLVY